MSLFVDTSVWSLALRRDAPAALAEVSALERALGGGDLVVTTGLVYQELLQGFQGPRAHEAIDALLAQLCIRHELELPTTDADFARIAEQEPLRCWRA